MKKTDPLMKSLLKKPEKIRLRIASELFRSIENDVDPQVEKTWRKEVRRRVAAIERGERTMIPWSEVRERLRKRLRAAA